MMSERLTGPLSVGDRLWWAAYDPKALELVIITALEERHGYLYVETANVRTGEKLWNREDRVRQIAELEPARRKKARAAR
jgi:hypothetical protein